jgi:1-acyl-sn-glycerol-3-phosphate acyltransferase
MFWWLMKHVILGPILRLFFHPTVEGLENLPPDGAVILAPNHLSFADDLLVPLVLKGRRATILAKSDYWDHWYTRWFFEGAGCVPVRRDGGSASRAAIDAAVKALREGRTVMLFPEGTRSPDGRLYRGKTGVARIALEAGVPVVPVGVIGTFELWPYTRRLPKSGQVTIRFGEPLHFDRFHATPTDRFVLRSVTDEIMYETMMLTGQEYVDEYGERVKKEMEARAKGGSEMAKPETWEREGADAEASQGTAEAAAAPAMETADVVTVPESVGEGSHQAAAPDQGSRS